LSIGSVRARIQEVQAEIRSYTNKPEQVFSSVLQEKLGTPSSGNSESAAASDGFTELTAETGANMNTDANISQALVNQLSGSGNYNPGYAAYNSACPQCQANLSSLSNYGSVTDYSLGLPEGFEKAAPYMEYVKEASGRYGMPVNLILGIMKAESDFNNECVSYAGAKGLMQLMPETAAEVGVTDVFDPRQNILGSVEYVTKLINKYGGDVRLALAAYNTGPGKIASRGVTSSESAEYLTVPQSIRDYAERVLKYAGYVA